MPKRQKHFSFSSEFEWQEKGFQHFSTSFSIELPSIFHHNKKCQTFCSNFAVLSCYLLSFDTFNFFFYFPPFSRRERIARTRINHSLQLKHFSLLRWCFEGRFLALSQSRNYFNHLSSNGPSLGAAKNIFFINNTWGFQCFFTFHSDLN